MPGGHTPFGTRALAAQNPNAIPPMTAGSAQFNGSSSLVLSPGIVVPNGQGLTIGLWVKNLNAANNPNVITQTANPSAAGNNMWWYGFHSGLGIYRFVTYASDTTNESPGNTGFPAQNSWTCFVFIYDDSVINSPVVSHYANNIHAGPAGGQDLPMHNNAAQCNLVVGNGVGDGFGNPAGGLVGCIDSLGIWPFAFSAAQAGEFWSGGNGVDFATLPADLASPTAWYNLDGPFASGPNSGKWPDYSGNKHHLTVSGTVAVGPARNH